MDEKMNEDKICINHLYNRHQKILLVGEGDFSFSACLARAFGSASNMVATSLDSKDTLRTKHWTSGAHLEDLERKGCLVLHEVDVSDMISHPALIRMKFDVIIFNFPHAGRVPYLNEQDDAVIEKHKELVEVFFNSAKEMLNKDGEVHVRHRDDYPYNRWKLKKLAKKVGLILKDKVEFRKEDYPGYHNKKAYGSKCNKQFPINQGFTFIFSLVKDDHLTDHQQPVASPVDVDQERKADNDDHVVDADDHHDHGLGDDLLAAFDDYVLVN